MRRASSGALTSGEGGRRSSLGDADDVIRQADLTGDLSLRSGGVSACIGSVSLPAGIRHRWAGLLQGRGSLNVRDKHLEHNVISGQLEQQMKTKPPAGTVVHGVRPCVHLIMYWVMSGVITVELHDKRPWLCFTCSFPHGWLSSCSLCTFSVVFATERHQGIMNICTKERSKVKATLLKKDKN